MSAAQLAVAEIYSAISRDHGLSFDVGSLHDVVMLNCIEVRRELRGQELASRALKQMTEICDRHQVTMEVEPASSNIDTVAWYGRHGFVWRDGYMAREPRPLLANFEEHDVVTVTQTPHPRAVPGFSPSIGMRGTLVSGYNNGVWEVEFIHGPGVGKCYVVQMHESEMTHVDL